MSTNCDLDAELYNKQSKLQYGLAHELLDRHKLLATASVLDVGCGDGKITADIARRVPQGVVIGIDASPSMINFAKNAFSKALIPNLDFCLERAEDLGTSIQFDVVTSFSCLHWVRQPKAALAKLCNLLKTSGELIILTYPKESLYYSFLQEAVEQYPEYVNLSAYKTMLPIREYKAVLNQCNMIVEEFSVRQMEAQYVNEEAIREYIKGWLTSFVPLPEELHQSFLDSIIQKSKPYMQRNEAGMITLPYTALMIRARKE